MLAVATHDTDYLLVKEEQLDSAITALRAAGHTSVAVTTGKRSGEGVERIAERLARRQGHFMPSELLRSQFDALEEPEDALVVDIVDAMENTTTHRDIEFAKKIEVE